MTLLANTAAANCALGAKPVVYSYDLMALYKSVYHLLLLLRGPRMSEGIETVSCPSVCLSVQCSGSSNAVERRMIHVAGCTVYMTCGPRKFRFSCKEVQHTCYYLSSCMLVCLLSFCNTYKFRRPALMEYSFIALHTHPFKCPRLPR